MLSFIGMIVGAIFGSRPSVSEERGSERKHFKYPSGYEFIQKTYNVKLGKIPFLRKKLFWRAELDSLPFFDVTLRLFFCGLEQRIELEQEKDWMTKNKKKGKCVYIKRPSLPFEKDFNVVLEILKERTKSYIEQRVNKDVVTKIEGNLTNVVISVRNDWSMTIEDYEVAHPVPTLKGLKILYVHKKVDGESDVDLREQDVTLHYEDLLSSVKKRQIAKLGSVKKFSLRIYLDVEPGITEIAFRYRK